MSFRCKYLTIAVAGMVLVLAACSTKGNGSGESRTQADSAADSLPALGVLSATYDTAGQSLLDGFRCVRTVDGPGIKAVVIPRGFMDTVSVVQAKRIFRYYVGGGTLLFLNPLSRDWLYFWRKMEGCRQDKSLKLDEKAATDLDNWASELSEVASYSGREPMFDAPIAYAIGLRVGDYYSQTDSLDVATLRRWLDGETTATIIREEYERRQQR